MAVALPESAAGATSTAGGVAAMAKVTTATLLPARLEAVKVTGKLPATEGAPLIRPFAAFRLRPGGNPAAVYAGASAAGSP